MLSIITSQNKKGILVSVWYNVKHFELLNIFELWGLLDHKQNINRGQQDRQSQMTKRNHDAEKTHALVRTAYIFN